MAMFTIMANIIFIFSSIRRRKLRLYIFSFNALSISSIFIILKVLKFSYRIIGNSLYFISSILFLLVILHEEYRIVKIKKQGIKNKIGIVIFTFQVPLFPILYSFQILTLIIMLLILILLIHVYLNKKTLIHVSFIILFILALSSERFTFLDHFAIVGALEVSYGANFGFVAALLLSSIVAFFKEKLITSKNELMISEKKYKNALNK